MIRRSGLYAGSLVAAVGASLCCILPLMGLVTGVGTIAIAAKFEVWRPFLLGGSLLLLALGVLLAYRERRSKCSTGIACAKSIVASRIHLFVVMAVFAAAAYPYYAGAFHGVPRFDPAQHGGAEGVGTTVQLKISGMTCPACANGLAASFLNLPGVKKAAVDYKSGVATISYEPGKASREEFEKLTTDAGYQVNR